ncbi:DUF2231 domain-containing protein [Alkalilimnicola sp. S0819]|uniref:DUF2231 domain-containing protein n=1 Tax=Alkalilimnicola sp. S0819 TaxID=2613922 RepID=UPI00186A6BA6|nr:DUF2231 domain-containing protein [Alkalilimnicola sp. S0819]
MATFRPGGGAKSQITVFGHPVHPMFIPFPIAFLSGVVVTDAAYLYLADPFWARMSFWLLTGGVGMGALAALTGLSDFTRVRVIRHHLSGWSHMLSAVVMLSFATVNLLQRRVDPDTAVWPWGFFLSVVTALMLAVAGWLGGKMVFEHNLGPGEPLMDAPDIPDSEGVQGGEPPEEG